MCPIVFSILFPIVFSILFLIVFRFLFPIVSVFGRFLGMQLGHWAAAMQRIEIEPLASTEHELR